VVHVGHHVAAGDRCVPARAGERRSPRLGPPDAPVASNRGLRRGSVLQRCPRGMDQRRVCPADIVAVGRSRLVPVL